MTHDPFKIDEPTCISFSGGRTSAYMLWRVLQSNGGLPSQAVVCFANTGKEDEATLRFVDQCSREWSVPITWLEFRKDGYEVVNYPSASRNGEPFEQLIEKRKYLPNTFARTCTAQLKIRAQSKYLKKIGFFEDESYSAIEQMSWLGIRADEQRRAAKIIDKSRIPLWKAGITKEIVGNFWKDNYFDLQLPNNNGVTMHGNCDLCYLKPAAQIVSLIQEKPERAIWWAKMEDLAESLGAQSGKRFHTDRPSYSQMASYVGKQMNMFDPNEEAIACFCGD